MGRLIVVIVIVGAVVYAWNKGWIAQWFNSALDSSIDGVKHAAPGDEGAPGPRRPRRKSSPFAQGSHARRASQAEAYDRGSVKIQDRLRSLPAGALGNLRRGSRRKACACAPTARSRSRRIRRRSARRSPIRTSPPTSAKARLITEVHSDADGCLQELTEIHQFVVRSIGEEMLWASSMRATCRPTRRSDRALRHLQRRPREDRLPHGPVVPLRPAHADHLRHPLQLLGAGIGSDGYFALIRNRRLSWLPLYLFGASPAVCTSFIEGRRHELRELAPGTMPPHATSLRMGRLGYQSDAQSNCT